MRTGSDYEGMAALSIMRDEILEQPNAIRSAIEQGVGPVTSLVAAMQDRDIRHVVIAARGTSDNAAVYAKYLIEIVCGLPVTLAAPSVFTLYDATLALSGSLVLGISQSGQATDVVQTLSSARAAGALTACITNVAGSPLTEVSDHPFLCHAGMERAVAATKSYTTSLALIALLAALLSHDSALLANLRGLPDAIHATLGIEPEIARSVERYRYMTECAVLARGINQATALEVALKITETSYLAAKPFSGADFLHGPIAMIAPGFTCMIFAPDGRGYPSLLELALTLQEREAELIVVAHSPEILGLAERPLAIETQIDEMLSPLLYIVPGQLWAYHLAKARGTDPDRPRGLHKVTLTR